MKKLAIILLIILSSCQSLNLKNYPVTNYQEYWEHIEREKKAVRSWKVLYWSTAVIVVYYSHSAVDRKKQR